MVVAARFCWRRIHHSRASAPRLLHLSYPSPLYPLLPYYSSPYSITLHPTFIYCTSKSHPPFVPSACLADRRWCTSQLLYSSYPTDSVVPGQRETAPIECRILTATCVCNIAVEHPQCCLQREAKRVDARFSVPCARGSLSFRIMESHPRG